MVCIAGAGDVSSTPNTLVPHVNGTVVEIRNIVAPIPGELDLLPRLLTE